MPIGHPKEDNSSVKRHSPQVCQVANQDEPSHQLTEFFEHQELSSVRTDADPLMIKVSSRWAAYILR